jgi:hypothetical protein
VPADGAAEIAITAEGVYGALRALETLSQLVTFHFGGAGSGLPAREPGSESAAGMGANQGSSSYYRVRGAPWAIADAPRFAHRGLMVDTGRHFLPLAVLRGVVDSLPYAKLNVLHWHISDSQVGVSNVRRALLRLSHGSFTALSRLYSRLSHGSPTDGARPARSPSPWRAARGPGCGTAPSPRRRSTRRQTSPPSWSTRGSAG